MIRIPLERQSDLRRFLKKILELTNLSTETVEKLKVTEKPVSAKFSSEDHVYSQAASIFEEYEIYRRNIQRAKQANTLK